MVLCDDKVLLESMAMTNTHLHRIPHSQSHQQHTLISLFSSHDTITHSSKHLQAFHEALTLSNLGAQHSRP
jgi:hypothetical protein